MAEGDIRAQKVLSVVKPILASILQVSGKDIPWGRNGLPVRAQAEALLRDGEGGVNGGGAGDAGRRLRAYYSTLSSLRNQAAGDIRWGKGEIPELEYMDSTLAGLYAFISDYVLGYGSGQAGSADD